MTSPFDLADEYGPYKVEYIHHPSVGLRAIVVVDNVACGPAIGGTRMAADVSVDECARLARAMTFKNAAAGLKHGGAKSVIFGDPKMPSDHKQSLIRAFASAINDLKDYIPGPDMGTNEEAMAWVHDETGRAVGLPRVIGGIPLDEIGATGLGVAVATEVAEEFSDIEISGANVAVQGFGAVGKHAARFLAERGARLVAASDSKGTIYCSDGIDVDKLIALKNSGQPVTALDAGTELGQDEIIGVDCDIWIPAARPDVLTKDNVHDLKARVVVQGANIPATAEAEAIMHKTGILSIPDFIANAGGVICASVEYHGGTEGTALEVIAEKVRANTHAVLREATSSKIAPRQCAERLARERVLAAMKLRRWS